MIDFGLICLAADSVQYELYILDSVVMQIQINIDFFTALPHPEALYEKLVYLEDNFKVLINVVRDIHVEGMNENKIIGFVRENIRNELNDWLQMYVNDDENVEIGHEKHTILPYTLWLASSLKRIGNRDFFRRYTALMNFDCVKAYFHLTRMTDIESRDKHHILVLMAKLFRAYNVCSAIRQRLNNYYCRSDVD
nr:orf30 [Trichoplusia ni single nucleopolyhedrovirus]